MASTLNSLKRLAPYAPVAIALIAGLVLGLLIGWVWWPVQWTNAWVTDLAPAQRAAFVSAVADAYVTDGTQLAVTRMQERLAPFGAALPEEIIAAMKYYQADPAADSVVLANIGRLATDLGVPVDASLMAAVAGEGLAEGAPAGGEAAPAGSDALPAQDVVPAQDAVPAESAGAASETGGRGAGIVTWLLAVLASVALIGGGIYLLLRLRNRELPESLIGPSPVPGASPAGGRSTDKSAQSSPSSRTSAWSSGGGTSAPANELSFDEEEDEEPAVRFGSLPGDDLDGDATAAGTDEGMDEESDDEGYDPAAPPRYSSARGTADTSGTDSVARHTASFDLTSRETPPADLDSFAARSYGAPVLEATRKAPQRLSADATAPARAPTAPRGAPIASYTLQFLAGMPDYIEAKNIDDPATGRYIGECGMGVSSKNRVLHNNPDQVIALEVWMYDKYDAKDNVNTTRVLLSEYAADRDYGQAFTKERDGNIRTFVAQPGTQFELDGRNLMLEGEITEVAYDRDGIFRSVTVEMSVLAKK